MTEADGALPGKGDEEAGTQQQQQAPMAQLQGEEERKKRKYTKKVTWGEGRKQQRHDDAPKEERPLWISKASVALVKEAKEALSLTPEEEKENTLKMELYAAATSNSEFMFNRVIKMDPNIDLAWQDNLIFRTAVDFNSPKIASLLLSKYRDRIDPTAKNNEPFGKACARGSYEIVEMLCRCKEIDLSSENIALNIVYCIRAGHIKVLEALAQKHMVNFAVKSNTLLITAVKNYDATEPDSLRAIEIILSRKEVNPCDCDNAALRWALQTNARPVVKLLLDDPRVDPLMENAKIVQQALTTSPLPLCELFLENPKMKDCPCGHDLLMIAVYKGLGDLVQKMCLSKNFNVDPSAFNNRALRKAVELECSLVAEVLMRDERVRNLEEAILRNQPILVNKIA